MVSNTSPYRVMLPIQKTFADDVAHFGEVKQNCRLQ